MAARWADPVLFSGHSSQESLDAARHGPACPQCAGGEKLNLSLVGGMQFHADTILHNETDSLSLVITRLFRRPVGTRLPAVVWYVLDPCQSLIDYSRQ